MRRHILIMTAFAMLWPAATSAFAQAHPYVGRAAIKTNPATRPATRKAGERSASFSRRKPAGASAPATTLQPVTEETRRLADQATREWSRKISRASRTDFTEVETDHFLIFHNWDAREQRFLEENVEGCYRAIARQFNVAPDATVFAGKPPLFMVAGDDEYSAALGAISPDFDPKAFIGIALTARNGLACMVMRKPVKADYEDLSRTEKRWASTLAHEMTHLFASRWHTDGPLPAWINEGLAELMEARLFPELDSVEGLARHLDANMSVQTLLEMPRPRTPREYACMRTLVETLVDTNQREFIRFVAKLKEGEPAEDALDECFGWTVDDLQAAWLDRLRDVYHVRPRRGRN